MSTPENSKEVIITDALFKLLRLTAMKMKEQTWESINGGQLILAQVTADGKIVATSPSDEVARFIACFDPATVQAMISLIESYQETQMDKRRLTVELDVAINGGGAAKQASLCDVVAQIRGMLDGHACLKDRIEDLEFNQRNPKEGY